MIDDDNASQPFTDQLGAAFDDAAHRERHRMDRRATVQRTALWAAVVALPIAVLAIATGSTDQANDAATEIPSPTSLPLVTDAPDGPDGPISTTAELVDAGPTTTERLADDSGGTTPPPTIALPPSPPTTEQATIVPSTSPTAPASSTQPASPTTSALPATDNAETCAPSAVLDVGDLGDGSTTMAWGDGAVISGFDASGSPQTISTRNNVIAVSGSRYDFQIDFDPAAGTSERIEIDFVESPCAITLTLAMFEVDELDDESGTTADESARWTALAADGTVIATADFSAGELTKDGQDRLLELSFGVAVDTLRIEAIGYGAGAFPDAAPNNSDFSVRRLTIS